MPNSKMSALRAEMFRSLQASRDAEDELRALHADHLADVARQVRRPVEDLTERDRATAQTRFEASSLVQRADVRATAALGRARTYALAYLVEANFTSRGRVDD